MENLESKLLELIDKLEAAGSELAPEVFDAALTAIYVDALKDAAITVAMMIVGGLLLRSGFRHISESAEEWKAGIRLAPGAGLCFFAFLNLLIDNPWLALFSPEAALVKQLLL